MGDADDESPKQEVVDSGLALTILKGHASDVTWVDFSANKTLVSSSNDKTVRVWKLTEDGVFAECSENPLKSPLLGHKYGVNCVRFSPFGTIIASCSTDGTVILWDAQVLLLCFVKNDNS